MEVLWRDLTWPRAALMLAFCVLAELFCYYAQRDWLDDDDT